MVPKDLLELQEIKGNLEMMEKLENLVKLENKVQRDTLENVGTG